MNITRDHARRLFLVKLTSAQFSKTVNPVYFVLDNVMSACFQLSFFKVKFLN